VNSLEQNQGLPMKIGLNGQVKVNLEGDYQFRANIDTYAGNSGSMVVNSRTLKVEVRALVSVETERGEGTVG
jgi:V8-like Glu-specific endopeptidase